MRLFNRLHPTLRYPIRATLQTVLLASIIPVTLSGFGFVVQDGATGAVHQGVAVLVVLSVIAITSAAIVFPLGGMILRSAPVLTSKKLAAVALLLISCASFFVACLGAVWLTGGGQYPLELSFIIHTGLFFTVLSSALVLPFTKRWLRLAVGTHNPAFEPTAASGVGSI